MKKRLLPYKMKGRVIKIALCFGVISLALFICLLTDIVKARVIDMDYVVKELAKQKQKQTYNPRAIPKVVIQRGSNNNKGFDLRCISWPTNRVNSGWTQDFKDSDFVIDYYVPPDKNAIICTTPLLAIALTARRDKPFVYEVYPTDYGWRIRIIIGSTEVKEACQSFMGNANCENSILMQQASVRYEP
jgi:hypothetical protein